MFLMVLDLVAIQPERICAGVREKLAESVVLRGARRDGHLVRAAEAAETLDAALMQEGTARTPLTPTPSAASPELCCIVGSNPDSLPGIDSWAEKLPPPGSAVSS